MKKCTKCLLEKNESEFSTNKQKKDGLNYKCKECQREYFKQHYEKNKQYYIDKAAEQKKQNTEINRKLKTEAKKNGCVTCGENHPAALDFHHIDKNTKYKSISKMGEHPPTQVQKEINKCIVLCSNCHRKLHWSGIDKGS